MTSLAAGRSAAPDVSVLIVTYRSGATVLEAIRSAREGAALAGLSVEILIVDNASGDGTAEAIAAAIAADPTARLIVNQTNEGFGRANNRAFEVARGAFALLLNPDAALDPAALGELVRFMRATPDAAAVAPSVTGRGDDQAESAGMAPGIRSAIGHFLFLNRLPMVSSAGAWAGFQLRRRRDREPRRVDWVSAAICLVRLEAIRAVGSFDPTIFLYGEDVELCSRLRRAGWSVWLLPAVSGHHAIAGSQGGVSTGWIDGIHAAYVRDGGRFARLVDLLVAAGLAARAIVLAVRGDRSVRGERMGRGARRALALATHGVRRRGDLTR